MEIKPIQLCLLQQCTFFSGFLFSTEEILCHSMSSPSTLTCSLLESLPQATATEFPLHCSLPRRHPGDGLTPPARASPSSLAPTGCREGEQSSGKSLLVPIPSGFSISGAGRWHGQHAPTESGAGPAPPVPGGEVRGDPHTWLCSLCGVCVLPVPAGGGTLLTQHLLLLQVGDQGKSLHGRGGQAVAQAARGSAGVTVPGSVQTPSGCGTS